MNSTDAKFAIRCCLTLLLTQCPAQSQPGPAAEPIIEGFIARASPSHPRHSEGDIVVLKDGSLLAAWSDFYGGEADDAAARISAAISRDDGRTWSEPRTLQENTGGRNVMSVSFLRDQLGGIQFFYGVKNSRTNLRFYVRRSSDEAKTWSDPVLITAEPGYHVMNNARVIQLKSGRILCPISFTSEVWTTNETFRTVACFSDDGGAHWRRGTGTVSCPKRGAMEPGLVELDDRRILQIIRTQTGRIWHCYSSDRGDTWTTPSPWSVAAPEAPSTLVRVPGDGRFLLVYNPGFSEGRDHGGRRTPLVAALSKDQGTTWSAPRMIESSPEATYAYVSVTFHKGRALLTFYHEPAETLRTSLRFKSIPLSWFAD